MYVKFVASGLCIALLMVPVLAQDKPQSPARPTKQNQPGEHDVNLINLDFPGGTVPQYIQAVRKAADDVNIVVLVDFSSVNMPPVQLRNVDPWSALLVLDSLPSYQGGRTVQIDVANSFQQRGVSAADERPVFTVKGLVTSPGHRSDPNESAVLEISELLGGELKDTDVLTAVQTALELLPDGLEPAKIKFHQATALLIAHGHPEQVQGVKNVVSELREQVSRRRRLEAERENLDAAPRVARESAQELKEALARVFELETRNNALHDEVQVVRRRFDQSEARLADCLAEMRSLQEQIKRQPGKPN